MMKSIKFTLTCSALSCIVMVFPHSLYATESRESVEKECSRLATDKTGYNPSNTSSSSNTIAKGAAIGAAAGTVVRAVGGKRLLKGAAIGAAAGAGAGALKNNQDKKKAMTDRQAYQKEYENCLKEKGLAP